MAVHWVRADRSWAKAVGMGGMTGSLVNPLHPKRDGKDAKCGFQHTALIIEFENGYCSTLARYSKSQKKIMVFPRKTTQCYSY